jgi:hypothetical protein
MAWMTESYIPSSSVEIRTDRTADHLRQGSEEHGPGAVRSGVRVEAIDHALSMFGLLA